MYPFINARFVFAWLWFASPVLWCGCGGGRLDVPSPGTYSPLVAVSLGITASESNPSPAPSPTPSPAGQCTNCNGTGRLGDGTVSVPCPVCGGDGKIESTADEIVPSLPAPVAVKSADCRCENCTCDPCECKLDPIAAPVPDGVILPPKYAPPKFPPVNRTPAPLTAEQKAELSNGSCADGSCSVQGDSGGRRGLFGRWRR